MLAPSASRRCPRKLSPRHRQLPQMFRGRCHGSIRRARNRSLRHLAGSSPMMSKARQREQLSRGAVRVRERSQQASRWESQEASRSESQQLNRWRRYWGSVNHCHPMQNSRGNWRSL
jgi:hypothetical protein